MKKPCLILLILSVLACAADPPRAPVEARQGEIKVESARPSTHTVSGGDTLYGIAWRYGMDYRTLASVNNIALPYTIYPGQRLSLSSKPAATTSTPPGKPRFTSPPKTKSAPAVTKPPPAPATRQASSSKQVSLGPVSAWRWPTRGKVVRGFSGTVHKGIDIDGSAGDPVRAVAPGRVVYSGSGIVGYGNLLIVKHNELYLSAYGHNRRLLVKEGESVKTGQLIAEKGSSATNTVKLHFEIRREGKPIDPKKLLPRR